MLVVHSENRVAGTGEVISHSDHARQTPGHLSYSDLGRAQNAGPTESVPLRTTRVSEPERLRPGKAYNSGLASDSSWQSNLEPKQCRLGKHTRHEQGQAQGGGDTESIPTHAGDICLQCSSLLTVQLKK